MKKPRPLAVVGRGGESGSGVTPRGRGDDGRGPSRDLKPVAAPRGAEP